MKLTDKEKSQVKEWTKALRSGEFKQDTNGNLYNGRSGTYCCLGVGCSVVDDVPDNFLSNPLDDSLPSGVEDYDGLMLKFQDYEFSVEYGAFDNNFTLYKLNDGGAPDEFTFPMLANLIDYIASGKDEIYTYDDLLEVAKG